ncbi:hypothetical protein FB451DRAFT_1370166 [Mycena latifolia]|nr:hypothetical protein FB451DRAFT_1370166 [Mycena latifolia]
MDNRNTTRLHLPVAVLHGGAITGAFVGGLALGLVVCVMVAWVLLRKMRSLEERLRRLGGNSGTMEFRTAPRPADVESERLLGGNRFLLDVDVEEEHYGGAAHSSNRDDFSEVMAADIGMPSALKSSKGKEA